MDNKTVLYAACGLIVILCGGLFGLWSSTNDQQAEHNRQTDRIQWERLSTLNDKIITNAGVLDRVSALASDHEARLRALERK